MPTTEVATTPAEPPHVALRLVVSSQGAPVSDLQPSEIEVLDEDLPRPLAAFEYVDSVTGDSPEPPGDFVLVLDDLRTPPSGTASAIAAGLGLIAALGPDDRLAIINTGPFPLVQPFSTDRASARATVRQFIGQRTTSSVTSRTEACRRSGISVGVVEKALEGLAQQPGARRALLVVGDGQRPYWGEARHEKCSPARKGFDRVIAAASVANVAIDGVDVGGQQREVAKDGSAPPQSHSAVTTARRPSDAPHGNLVLLAELTGGTFSTGSPAVADTAHEMVRHTRQYYRVLYQQPDVSRGDRNRFRRIHVRVHRPQVEVRARTRYVPQWRRESR